MTDELRPSLRRAHPEDAEAVAKLLQSCFGGAEEAQLLQALDADGDIVLTVVGELDGALCAIGSFARVRIRDAAQDVPAAALFLLGVTPERRGRGVGAALVRVGLAQVRRKGAEAVLTRGDAAYFERFGFTRFMVDEVSTAWSGGELRGLSLVDGINQLKGEAFYPRAFFGEGRAA